MQTQISPRRLDWLTEQVEAWRADGLVADEQAAAIRARYEKNTRASITTLALFLGVAFLGVGVLSLIATNVEYDELSPAIRFGIVATLWLGFTVAGTTSPRFGGPLRLLAALLFGGVIFQAAQSLNVPAYEPVLVLAWSAGALALAYGARSVGPLVVGVFAGLGWYLWTLMQHSGSAAAFVLGLALATPVLAAAAVAHGADRMAVPWRRVACLTALIALFVAAFPPALGAGQFDFGRPVYAGIAVALAALVAGALRTTRRGVVELAAAGGVALAALALVATVPEGHFAFGGGASGAVLVHALVASLAFLAVAVGVAVAGVVHERPDLVNLAATALVLFVTLQSFGLFAPLLSGAGLFLLVGTLLVGSGLLVDRGRRRLREEIPS